MEVIDQSYLHDPIAEQIIVQVLFEHNIELTKDRLYTIWDKLRFTYGCCVESEQAEGYRKSVEKLCRDSLPKRVLKSIAAAVGTVKVNLKRVLTLCDERDTLPIDQKIELALTQMGVPTYDLITHRLKFSLIKCMISRECTFTLEFATYKEVVCQVRLYLARHSNAA